MKILSSSVDEPESEVKRAINKLSSDTKASILSLQNDVKENKIDYTKFTESLGQVLNESLTRLEAIDNSVDYNQLTAPIAESIIRLKSELGAVSQSLAKIKFDPVVNVQNAPPDLKELKQVFNDLPKVLNEIFSDLDVIPAVELRKTLKEIVELLKAIEKKQTVFYGGGGGGSVSNIRGIDIDTGNEVPLYAVESQDFPGKYGLIVLNPDGTSIGTGGGTPAETFKRITDTGDIRVTSSGDTRVYAT